MAHILLLHTSPRVRDRWASIASAEGHLVHEAQNLDQALEKLSKHTAPCSIIIAGSKETATSEGDTASGIAKLKKTVPGLCLILVSRKPTISEIATCIRAGALDYIDESSETNEMLRSLNTAVNYAASDELNRRLESEHRLYQEHLETLVERQTLDISSVLTRLIRMRDASREEISSELHDQIGQGLLALKLQIQSLQKTPCQYDDFIVRIDELASIVRNISHRLSPHFVQSAGIQTALELLSQQVATETGIVFTLDIEALESLPADRAVHAAIHRFVEEGLANVRQHSQATECSLTVSIYPRDVEICIEDNGLGFAPSASPNSLGLLLLHEYAARLEGFYRLESAPGNGTSLLLHIPRRIFCQPD